MNIDSKKDMVASTEQKSLGMDLRNKSSKNQDKKNKDKNKTEIVNAGQEEGSDKALKITISKEEEKIKKEPARIEKDPLILLKLF